MRRRGPPARAAEEPVALPAWAQVSDARMGHIERVAALVQAWAEEMNTPAGERERWLRAVRLHDALKDAPEAFLEDVSDDPWGIPALRHGPAAAALAAREGERDRGVLDAIRFHSVGYRGWDMVGHVLYLADYLEPGRRFHHAERDVLAAAVPHGVEAVLRDVARGRVSALVAAGMPLLPETVDFWNGLVCDA